MSSRVTILGPGLLGGSLALALKQRTETHVTVWARREQILSQVLERGIDQVTCDAGDAVREADMVVLATPVGAMPALATEIAKRIRPEVVVTDVGSVKAPVVSALAEIFRNKARFIGSHPMAGSEQTGFAAARPDLFQGAVCILTPDADTSAETTQRMGSFWQNVGCVVRTLAPAEHDSVVAWISHLPHLLAAALVDCVAGANPAAFGFCGPGFRDTTRIASGPPEMWTEILGENREAVRHCIDGLVEKLRGLSTLLASASAEERDSLMNQLLTKAKTQRDSLRFPKNLSDV